MIKNIEIQGFQSHTHSTFNLSHKLTVITGPTDCGKTAIIRAIKWLAFGEPKGDDFINQNMKVAKVTINLLNGISVSKERKGNQTIYTHSQIPTPFVQADPPEEIVQALGLEKISFGEDLDYILNIAFQLDAPFLISQPGSVGAKALGAIAGTKAVDGAIKGTSKDIYIARQDKQQADKQIEKISLDLLQFAELESLKKQLAICEELIQKISNADTRKSKISDLKAQFDFCCRKVAECRDRLGLLSDLPDISGIELQVSKYNRIGALYERLSYCIDAVNTLETKLQHLETIQEANSIISKLESKADKLNLLTTLSTKHSSFSKDIQEAEATLQATKYLIEAEKLLKQVANIQERFSKIESLLKALQGVSKRKDNLSNQLDAFSYALQAKNLLETAEKSLGRYEVLEKIAKRQKEINLDKAATMFELKNTNKAISNFKDKLEKAWEQAGGICPTCERPLGWWTL